MTAEVGEAKLGSLFLRRRFFLVIEGRDLLHVFGFKDVVAVEAAQIVDPIPTHHELAAGVLTRRHRKEDYPYSNEGRGVVKTPPLWLGRAGTISGRLPSGFCKPLR